MTVGQATSQIQVFRATDDTKDAFRAVVPDAPAVGIKAMLGDLGALVNGDMFASLFGSAIGVRIPGSAQRVAAVEPLRAAAEVCAVE